MKIKAIMFDMDGTLYSSEPLIEEVYDKSVQQFNKKNKQSLLSPTFEQIEPLIGQPVKVIYQTLFPGLTETEMKELGQLIGREFQKAIGEMGGRLFPGVKEILAELKQKNYLLFVASNGKREYLDSIIRYFDLPLEPFVCIEDYNITHKGEILQYYQRLYHLMPHEIIMVGDRASDLEAARFIGCLFIGCDFGHGNREEIEQADFIASDFYQIPALLKKIENLNEWIDNKN